MPAAIGGRDLAATLNDMARMKRRANFAASRKGKTRGMAMLAGGGVDNARDRASDRAACV